MDPREFEDKMRWIFSFFDKDGDGVVTIDELKDLLKDIRNNYHLEEAGMSFTVRITIRLVLIQNNQTKR